MKQSLLRTVYPAQECQVWDVSASSMPNNDAQSCVPVGTRRKELITRPGDWVEGKTAGER